MRRILMGVLIVFLLMVPVVKIKALSVSESDVEISKGGNEKVELYANVEEKINEISFNLVYSTYDIVANFIVDSKYEDILSNGIRHTIRLDESQSGKILLGTVQIDGSKANVGMIGTINIYNATAKTYNEESINLDTQNINVKIVTEKEKKDTIHVDVDTTMLLNKIDSKIVKIDLKKDVFEYDVTIDRKITELDLKVIPNDENCDVDISTQKIAELSNHQIIITAKLGETTQKYMIHVHVDKSNEKLNIDEDEFVEDVSYKKKWVIIIIILNVVLLFSMIFIKIIHRK